MRVLCIAIAAGLLQGCSAVSAVSLGLALTSVTVAPLGKLRHHVDEEDCENCEEAKVSADQLAEQIPEWMEHSRSKAGPTATVTRTGFFTWQLTVQNTTATCRANVRTGWRCTPDQVTSFQQL